MQKGMSLENYTTQHTLMFVAVMSSSENGFVLSIMTLKNILLIVPREDMY